MGGTTHQVQRFGRINLAAAGAISDARRNGFLHRPTSKKDKKTKGMFHQFDEILRYAIVKVAMKDTPKTRAANDETMKLQQRAKQVRENLKKERNMEKASEEFIEAIYYYWMYYSDACWKGSVSRVKQGLKRLATKTGKYEALKENIMMRVKGFGWEWAKHAWSKNNRQYTIKELAEWLEFIISEEKKVKIKNSIPEGPPTSVPKRKENSILGTLSDFVKSLDKKYFDNEEEFKERAEHIRQQRELRGEGSMYALLQPFDRPDIRELVGRRIDVLSFMTVEIDDEKKSVGRWCQGEVLRAYESTQPMVWVLWDPMPDVGGYETAKETNQRLLPSKWKKDVDGAWRMDVEVEVEVDRNIISSARRVVCDEEAIKSESDVSEESEPETGESESEYE